MTDRKLSADEARILWREAARRLRAVDVEPPLTAARIDALGERLGPRRSGQDLRSWLRGDGAAETAGNVIGFVQGRQRLRPVATFARLAADTAGSTLELPDRELETQDGQFRLRTGAADGAIVLELQALGFTADDFAGRTVALVDLDDENAAVAVLELDQDGDGSARFPDTTALRRALLRPVIALVEDL
jgi:hypothetical protein